MTRATGHNVILAPREDLFAEVDRETGIELVSLANSVTSVPDNLACCEIISVGELVQNVKVGDLAFIDFFRVKQPFILANDELYIAGCEAFEALYRPEDQTIQPLPNYVVTRRVNERMMHALTGTDRIHVPLHVLTQGIGGGKTSNGVTASWILYEEVVAVGPLTKTGLPGLMTKNERALIEVVLKTDRNDGYMWADSQMLEVARCRYAVAMDREHGRDSDISPGDLVVFCSDISQRVRVRGEVQHIVPYDACLATIDDVAVLDEAVRRGEAGKLAV